MQLEELFENLNEIVQIKIHLPVVAFKTSEILDMRSPQIEETGDSGMDDWWTGLHKKYDWFPLY